MYCKKEASNGFFFQRTNQLLSPNMDMDVTQSLPQYKEKVPAWEMSEIGLL